MQLLTPVVPEAPAVRLTPRSTVLSIGSCFADHIGERLARCLPTAQSMVNPCGTLYNPVSILSALRLLLSDDGAVDEARAFQGTDGQWHHWDFSTRFTDPTREGLLSQLQEQTQRARAVMDRTDVLFLTFSTDHVYYLSDNGRKGEAVANCHKQPARLFTEQVMDGEVYHDFVTTLHVLTSRRPDVRVVLTLSPYRYAKYGMHGNALCKARLLLFIDRLATAFPDNVRYFPAYETVTDELRDYRFYDTDMLHPSAQAVDYVWEKFRAWAFDGEMARYADERLRIVRDLSHRPVSPDSDTYRLFRKQTERRKAEFLQKWNTEW